MKKKLRQLNAVIMLILILAFGFGCGKQKVVELPVEVGAATSAETTTDSDKTSDDFDVQVDVESASIEEDGIYDSKEDVSEYIHEFGKLPQNYITKKEAKALGWSGGSVEEYAPGKCIGGDRFGNYESLLPEEDGRRYFECDIDTLGKSKRGPKRIIYSNDGLIFYTEDHYESYEQLY